MFEESNELGLYVNEQHMYLPTYSFMSKISDVSNDVIAEIDKSAMCNLPCSEHVSPRYPGAQLHVLLATQTPVLLAHGGLQTMPL